MMVRPFQLLAVIALLLLALTSAWGRRLPEPLGQLDRGQITEQQFGGRALDPIEGIWTTDDNTYELAIVRSKPDEYKTGDYRGYDYFGVIVDTTNRDYRRGELKCLLKKAASSGVYPGIWFMGNKRENGTTFVLSDPNTVRYLTNQNEPIVPTTQNTLFRIYPQSSASPGQPPATAPGVRSATGFFVASDLVVTNYHVVADCKDLRLVLGDGTEVPGTAVVSDPSNDVALIRASRHIDRVTALPIGDVLSVKSGSRVYTIGFPMPEDLGANPKVSEGIINSVTGMDDDPRMYQISIPIQPGNSGGPLLDDKGCVIGVVTSTLNNIYAFRRQGTIPQNVNFAMKINYLDNLIAVLPGGAQLSVEAPEKQLDVSEVMATAGSAIVMIVAKG